MESITAVIISITAFGTAIVTLIVTILKAKKEIEDTLPNKIKEQSNINIEIITRLEEIKEYLIADRVQIYDFHNGGHFANGRSALKVSCSYEVVRAGVKGHQKELQDVPLSCIPRFIRTLLNRNELRCNDLEEIKNEMPGTYQIKKEQEVISFYDIILNNKNGEPIGFLAIQYSKTNCVEFTQEEMNQILKVKFFIEDNLERMVSNNRKENKK